MSEKQRFCDVCGVEIEPGRLVTKTHLCGKHGREIEKYGGEFTRRARHDNVGKGGIKQVTAGVTVSIRRNQLAIERLKDDYDREMWDKRKQEAATQAARGA